MGRVKPGDGGPPAATAAAAAFPVTGLHVAHPREIR